jgi:hypothetical protein
MKDLEEQRVCVKFCFKLAKTFTETFQMLKQAYAHQTVPDFLLQFLTEIFNQSPPNLFQIVFQLLAKFRPHFSFQNSEIS